MELAAFGSFLLLVVMWIVLPLRRASEEIASVDPVAERRAA